jgi:hypothetical protein
MYMHGYIYTYMQSIHRCMICIEDLDRHASNLDSDLFSSDFISAICFGQKRA